MQISSVWVLLLHRPPPALRTCRMTASPALDRRSLLRGALAVGALAAAPAAFARSAEASEIAPVDINLHLLNRATYGPTQAALDEVRAVGMVPWISAQLNPASID